MEELKIDYSEVPNALPGPQAEEGWEAPPHKYFGPRDQKTGKMKPEPVYMHQEFPKTMYAKRDGKIVARLVLSEEDVKALGSGWVNGKDLTSLGYIGAPSRDQLLEANRKAEERPRDTLTLKKQA